MFTLTGAEFDYAEYATRRHFGHGLKGEPPRFPFAAPGPWPDGYPSGAGMEV